MTVCPHCGARYDVPLVFCTECGTRLPSSESQPSETAPRPAYDAEPEAYTQAPQTQPAQPTYQSQYTQPPQDAGYPSQTPRYAAAPQEPRDEEYGSRQTYAPPMQPMSQPLPSEMAQGNAWEDAAPPKGSIYAPLSVGGYIGAILLMAVPVIGWIFAIVWACGGCRKRNLRNFALASILCVLISILLTVAACVLLTIFARPFVNSVLEPYGYMLEDTGYSDASGVAPEQISEAEDGSQAQLSGEPGSALTQLEAIFQDDYYLEFTMNTMGVGLSGVQAKEGSRTYICINMMDWYKTYQIQDGSTLFTFDPDRKEYYTSQDSSEFSVPTDMSGYTYTGNGSDSFNGQTLSYESYVSQSNSSSILKIFTQDSGIAGIRATTSDANADVVFTQLSTAVPAGITELPADCTEVTEEEFNEGVLSF